MSWEIDMFKKFELTEEEKQFIAEANGAPGCSSVKTENFNMADKYKVLSNFYLAKQIEASSISSSKQGKIMIGLTIVIASLGAVQLVDLILKLCGILS